MPEHSGGLPPERTPELRAYAVSLLNTTTAKHYEGRGARIRLGRARECEIRIDDPLVSMTHAELTIGREGGLVVRDAGSERGTFLNGVRLTRPLPIRMGDQVQLGEGGPSLLLEGLGTEPQRRIARPPAWTLRHRGGVLVVALAILLLSAVFGLYRVFAGHAR